MGSAWDSCTRVGRRDARVWQPLVTLVSVPVKTILSRFCRCTRTSASHLARRPRMRSLLLFTLVIFACGQVAAQAQDRKFPYQAIVEIDGEYVRSGPGPSF